MTRRPLHPQFKPPGRPRRVSPRELDPLRQPEILDFLGSMRPVLEGDDRIDDALRAAWALVRSVYGPSPEESQPHEQELNRRRVRRHLFYAEWGRYLRGVRDQASAEDPCGAGLRYLAELVRFGEAAAVADQIVTHDEHGGYLVDAGVRPALPSPGRPLDVNTAIRSAIFRYARDVPGANVIRLLDLVDWRPRVPAQWTWRETCALARELGYDHRPTRGVAGESAVKRAMLDSDPFRGADATFAVQTLRRLRHACGELVAAGRDAAAGASPEESPDQS